MSDKKLNTDDVMASVGTGVTVAAAPAIVGAIVAAPVAIPTLAILGVGSALISLHQRWMSKRD